MRQGWREPQNIACVRVINGLRTGGRVGGGLGCHANRMDMEEILYYI